MELAGTAEESKGIEFSGQRDASERTAQRRGSAKQTRDVGKYDYEYFV